MITIQYLEPGPRIAEISPSQARTKLQAAFDRLPIDCLLVGWDIPPELEDICRNESASAGVKLFRWHPLLTGDGTFYPKKEWRTRNLDGLPLPGFRELPEFTFVCPNNPATQEAILTHVSSIAQSARYEGIFLDRMRFPSPAGDSINSLACFCEHCQQVANNFGLDLEALRQMLKDISKINVIRVLFGKEIQPLSAFLDFRQHTITQFIAEVVETIRTSGLGVGLDCFSPTLIRMVGQDLKALAALADWTKIMVYVHAFGPATIPFEITDLANWLIDCLGIDEAYAVSALTEITTLISPRSTLSDLRAKGLSTEALSSEISRGRASTVDRLLAGIELVEIPGVSELDAIQVEADLRAIKAAGVDGLSLSWDLWHIPLERLELVQSVWFS